MLKNFFREYPQRSPSGFVGREAELKQFNRALHQLPYTQYIINLVGQSGVGKTELLKQYRNQLDPVGELWASTTEAAPDVPAVMGEIAEQFKKQGYPLRKFSDRYRTYLQCLQRLETDPEKPQGLTNAVGQVATKGIISGARQIPLVGVAVGMFDENTLLSQGGEWLTFVAKKLANKDDVRLLQSPTEELTLLFLRDLQNVANKRLIVLFFDVYERTSAYLDKWLRDILTGKPYGHLPDKNLLVISGQQELSRSDWNIFSPKLKRQYLKPFTEREAEDFLRQKGITDTSLVAEIIDQSERLPLLLNTLAVQAPTTANSVVDRAEDVVDRYLRWIEDPQKRKLVLDASLVRFINQDVVSTLTTPEQADALFDWLIKRPFVIKKAATWCYEPLMQKMMVRYKRQRTVLEWAALHEKLAQLYQQLCDVQGLDADVSQYIPLWQNYQLEKLYHQLCQAPQTFLQSALTEFLAAFNRSPLTAYRWAETIRQAGEETAFNELTQWGEQMILGLNAYDKEEPTDAISLFSHLLSNINLDPEWQAKILYWRGNLYGRSKQYAKALLDLNNAIELVPESGEYYRDRGLVYLSDEQYSPALSDLSKAVELNPEDAKAIAYRGIVYLAKSDYSMAIQVFTNALKVKSDFPSVLVSRGAAYCDLRNYQRALADLEQALTLSPGYLGAIAQRGKVYQAIGRSDDALRDLNQVLAQYPDNLASLLSRGIVYRETERYQEAVTDFSQVLSSNPNPQEAEQAFAHRGETYRRLERYQDSIDDLSQSIDQNLEDVWTLGLRGTAHRQFGSICSALEDYNQVLELEAENDWWYYSRALAHHLLGEFDLMQSDLEKAIQIANAPTCRMRVRVQLNLALYYLAAKDVGKALTRYREFLPKASWLLHRGTNRELKELFVVIPIDTIISPDSLAAKKLSETLSFYKIELGLFSD